MKEYLLAPIDWGDVLAQVERLHVGGADDRGTWTRLAASLQAAGGTDTHWEIFHTISKNSGGYRSERDCRNTWKSFCNPRITQGTIIQHLTERGVRITHRGDKMPSEGLKTASNPKPQHFKPAQATYYTEREGLAAQQAAAVLKSPLIGFIRRLYWGSPWWDNIGRSLEMYRHGYDGHGHDVFRYYDISNQLCKVRYCAYHGNGHRVRHGDDCDVKYPLFTLPKGQTIPCFYGEHLAALNPEKPVAIVESEKTALVMSMLIPSLTWVATGGADYLKPLSALPWIADWIAQGNKVIVFPDVDQLDAWNAIAQERGFATASACYRWYNTFLSETDQKADIADFCIARQAVKAKSETMSRARRIVKRDSRVWDLMKRLQCHVVV